MNILLGVTGSVSASLTPKLVKALQSLGEVRVVVTEAATRFLPDKYANRLDVITGNQEDWQPGDPILHTDLKNWADVLVIAPCTANTLAKIANGLADNLLTDTVRAWSRYKPMFIAPAMNVDMWGHYITDQHLQKIKQFAIYTSDPIIPPQVKTLACGDVGMGALANIEDIVAHIKTSLRWVSPLSNRGHYGWDGFIPENPHPGSFGKVRKFDTHTGVDLYVPEGKDRAVQPVQPGVVVDIVDFTGANVIDQEGKPMSWWNDTKAVLVKGASGVVVYGEIEPNPTLTVGSKVGYYIPGGIGTVIPVLPPSKIRPDIPHHSNSMLHIELYESEVAEKNFRWGTWENGKDRPAGLLDPTPYLKDMVLR